MKKLKVLSILLAFLLAIVLISCEDDLSNTGGSPENTACNICRSIMGPSWFTSLEGQGFTIQFTQNTFMIYEILWGANGWTVGDRIRIGFHDYRWYPISRIYTLEVAYEGRVIDGTATHSGNTLYYADDSGLRLTFYCRCFWR
jgi:hypothetical protein